MPRILLVKTSSLGDVISNLPVVADIHRHIPDAQVDWVVEEAIVDIPALHPQVEVIISVALRRWRKRLFALPTWREIRGFKQRLQKQTYDAVIDTQGLLKSALIARLAKGPVHGQDRRSAREPMAARFYQYSYPIPRVRHAVERNRVLAALALDYPNPETPPDYGLVMSDTDRPPDWFPGDYVFCLHGTARESKLWPIGNWTQLAAELHKQGVAAVLAWGSEKERKRSQDIAASGNAVVPPTRLSILQTATVIQRAKAVIGVDTGFVHLAAALCRPVVGIYTDTDPKLCGVLSARACTVDNVGNIGQIPTVREVLQALQEQNIF